MIWRYNGNLGKIDNIQKILVVLKIVTIWMSRLLFLYTHNRF